MYSIETLERRVLLSSQIGTVTMPFNGTLSAAVYDENGQLVRTLYKASAQSAGTVNLIWDGLDDFGNATPTNHVYEWRAITSQASATDEGGVGDSGNPISNTTESNGSVAALAVDPSGNLYSASWWEEPHKEIRKLSASGTHLWSTPQVGAYNVATDGTYVYAAQSPYSDYADRIYRYNASDGTTSNFTGSGSNVLTVNATRPDTLPAGKRTRTTEQSWDWEPLRGMAVDATRLWVTDYFNDRVLAYDKLTGNLLAQFNITNPLGIVAQAVPSGGNPGVIWVANGSERVIKYTYTIGGGGAYSFTEVTAAQISNLNNPYGLAIGGSSSHLFVTELGDQDVLEFDISGSTPTPAGLQIFGQAAVAGPVSDAGFRFSGSIAVDSSGVISVADTGNRRVQRFNSNGTLYQSIYSEFQPGPWVDKFPTSTTHRLFSAGWDYEVDPGNAHTGWMGDGTWRLSGNWRPTNDQFFSEQAQRLTLTVGGQQRDFIFYLGGSQQGVVIYAVDPSGTGMRLSAIVGGAWTGLDNSDTPVGGRYNWTDANGNGKIDWDPSATNPNNGEIKWDQPLGSNAGFQGLSPGEWMDTAGNFWIANMGGATVKVPLLGFDAQGNPLYDWVQRQTAVPVDGSAFHFDPHNVKTTANGDIYTIGNVSQLAPSYFWMGGTAVSRYDASGARVSVFLQDPANPTVAIATDQNDPQGKYFYAGHSAGLDHWVEMFTNDGLLVTTAHMGPASGGSTGGWIDTGTGITAFTDPHSGKTYIYAEEVYFGKSNRYRIDDLSTISRTAQFFTWNVVPSEQVVTVQAVDAVAGEEGTNPGAFRITRIGSTTSARTVNYTMSGTATNGSDYTTLSGSVTLGVGEDQKTISLAITNDGSAETDEVATLTLGSGSGYTIGTNNAASVTIEDDDNLPTVTLTVNDENAGEDNQNPALFTVTRHAPLATALTVYYTMGGSALPGTDYTALSGSVVIPAGQRTATITLSPIDDATIETYSESAILTLSPNATYTLGSTSSGRAQILDDDASAQLMMYYDVNNPNSWNGTDLVDLAGFGGTLHPSAGANVDSTYGAPTYVSSGGPSNRAYLNFTKFGVLDDSGKDIAAFNQPEGDKVGGYTFEGYFYIPAYGSGLDYKGNSSIGSKYIATESNQFIALPAGGSTPFSSSSVSDAPSSGFNPDTVSTNLTTTVLPRGSWVHLVKVHDPDPDHNTSTHDGTIKFYLNGSLVSSASTPIDTDGDGVQYWTRGESYGAVGSAGIEVKGIGYSMTRYYRGVLSDAEVLANYNEANTSAGAPSAPSGLSVVAQSNAIVQLAWTDNSSNEESFLIERSANGSSGWVQIATTTAGVTSYTDTTTPSASYSYRVRASNYAGNSSYTSNAIAPTTVAASVSDAVGSEAGSNTATIVVTRFGQNETTGSLTVNYTVAGTATSGSDYTALSGSVTIPNGQSSANVVVTPIDDSTADGDETVTLTISTNVAYSIGTSNSTAITIQDDEPVISISATDPSAAEAGTDPGTITFTRSDNGASDVTVNYTVGGTASSGDYTPSLAGSVVVPGHAVYADATKVNLLRPLDASGNIATTTGWTNLTSGTYVQYGAQLGIDSGVWSSQLNFPTASTSNVAAYQITLPNAVHIQALKHAYNFYRASQYRILGSTTGFGALTELVGWTNVSSDSPAADTINANLKYIQIEFKGSASYQYLLLKEVQAFGASGDSIPLSSGYNLFDQRAAAGAVPNNSTYRGGSWIDSPDNTTDLNVDTYLRGNNTGVDNWFVVPLGSSYKLRGAAVGFYHGQQWDNGITISVTNDTSINGGTSWTTVYTQSGALSSATLPFAAMADARFVKVTTPGAGSGGALCELELFTSAGTPGAATITVTPVNDSTAESDETLQLTLGSGSGYTINTAANVATVTIADNEPRVSVAALDAAAAEMGVNTATYRISRTNGTSGNLTVNYTMSGTATNGTDYTSLSGSAVIPNGQSYVDVLLTPVNDTSIEVTETAILTISSNSAYSIDALAPAATATIVDNDKATVTIAATDASAAETGSNSGTFTITRSGTGNVSAGDLTVFYSANGTAWSGDYATLLGKAVIPNGSFSTTVTISPANDNEVEADESVRLTIDPRDGYIIGSTASAIVTIASDDVAAVNIATTDGSADEAGSDPGVLTVNRTDSNPGNVTVNYALSGTASSGDYGPVLSGSVVVPTLNGSIAATNFADGSKVNLFRQVDSNGNFAVQTAWANLTAGAGVSYAASYGVDAGNHSSQVDFPTQSSSNAAAYQITLPSAVHIQSIVHSYGGHRASQYRILASTTGFGSMTQVLGWTTVTSDNPVAATVNTTAKYIQIEFLGTAVSSHLLLKEIQAFGASTDSIGVKAGYNLFDQDAVATPIPAGPAFKGGSWIDDPNLVRDRNVDTYLRGRDYGTDNWFILPLNDLYALSGAAVGFYHGQSWTGGIKIEVTDDHAVGPDTTWKQVYYQSTNLGSATLSFNGTYTARFVRVTTPGAGSGGALCEFEVFAANLKPTTLSITPVDDQAVEGSETVVATLSTNSLYTIGSPSSGMITIADNDVAFDGFESGNGSGGSGWADVWSLSGAAAVTTSGTPETGSNHLRLTSGTGVATRTVNLTGATNMHLNVGWKANSFESGETATIEVYDGTWHTVLTILDTNDDNAYHRQDINLSGFTMTSGFKIRISSHMGDTSDELFIDDVNFYRGS